MDVKAFDRSYGYQVSHRRNEHKQGKSSLGIVYVMMCCSVSVAASMSRCGLVTVTSASWKHQLLYSRRTNITAGIMYRAKAETPKMGVEQMVVVQREDGGLLARKAVCAGGGWRRADVRATATKERTKETERDKAKGKSRVKS